MLVVAKVDSMVEVVMAARDAIAPIVLGRLENAAPCGIRTTTIQIAPGRNAPSRPIAAGTDAMATVAEMGAEVLGDRWGT